MGYKNTRFSDSGEMIYYCFRCGPQATSGMHTKECWEARAEEFSSECRDKVEKAVDAAWEKNRWTL